jgi:hypothetical protein
MILLTIPGIVRLGFSEVLVVSSLSSAIFADLVIRGFAISLLTLASVVFPVFFLIFLCNIHPHDVEKEAAQAHFAELRRCALKDSLSDKNNQANNHQRPDQSVSEHCYPLIFDQRLSMEFGGKGSFQAIKLQRLARTTVCSHPAKGMAAMFQ